MPDNGKKSKKPVIIAIATIVAIAAAAVAIVMVLKSKTITKDFFKSDDTKLVYNVSSDLDKPLFDSTEVYMVYDYKDGKITKLTTYYGYETEELAKAALDKYADIFVVNDDTLEVIQSGSYIGLVAAPYLYESVTVDSVNAQIDLQTKGDDDEPDYTEENIIENADVEITWD